MRFINHSNPIQYNPIQYNDAIIIIKEIKQRTINSLIQLSSINQRDPNPTSKSQTINQSINHQEQQEDPRTLDLDRNIQSLPSNSVDEMHHTTPSSSTSMIAPLQASLPQSDQSHRLRIEPCLSIDQRHSMDTRRSVHLPSRSRTQPLPARTLLVESNPS